MWGTLISTVGGVVGNFINRRSEVAAAKHEAKMESIKATAQWEIEQAKAGQNGWKDEYITIFMSSPFGVMFLGSIFQGDGTIVDRVQQAFVAMSVTPDWYQWTFVAVMLSGVGIKAMNQWKK